MGAGMVTDFESWQLENGEPADRDVRVLVPLTGVLSDGRTWKSRPGDCPIPLNRYDVQ